MRRIRVLVDSFADAGMPNAQMGNAREIMSRLDSRRFHVSTFVLGEPDPRIAGRENTRLIQLPKKRQTIRILSEFLLGRHDVLFYMKASPASKWYLSLQRKWRDRRVTVGSIESQCDLHCEPDVPQVAIRLWEQTVLRCDRLFSNSRYVRDSLEREYGLRSEVIATGVDTIFFVPPANRAPNPRARVLFVGSLRRRKHPDFLLAAAARFPGADFRIAGEGPMAGELVADIARMGLKNVALPGLLNAEQLREEYGRADIFLFPSTFEGSPKVILEAAACQLPVIVRNNYSPETVIDGVTGYQAGSDEEMFSSLERLIASPDLRRQLGRAGRVHSQRYDWDVITAQWEEAFERMAGMEELRKAS